MTLSRLERLRMLTAADLEKLPDLLPEPEVPIQELAITPVAALAPADIAVCSLGVPLVPQGLQTDPDSEAACYIGMKANAEAEEAAALYDHAVDGACCHSSDSSSASSDMKFLDGPTAEDSMQRGHLSPLGLSFCPVLVVSEFPYRYLPKMDSESVADMFFNADKFWMRTWHLFYVWQSGDATRPLILIPEAQFAELLRDVDANFKHLYLNAKEACYRDLVIKEFPSHPDSRPRFLGTSESKEMYDRMVQNTPPASFRPSDEALSGRAVDGRDRQTFRQMVESAVELNKARSKVVKTQSQHQRIAKQQNVGRQLTRAQRYLGLRYKRDKVEAPIAAATFSPGEQNGRGVRKVNKPPLYECEGSPVFVCIDVECFELDHTIITEVGVATLDTRDLKCVSPGAGGEAWFSLIHARHFRIIEYKHMVNTRFVHGCADRFEFGESEFVPKADAARIVMSCFDQPFSRWASEANPAAALDPNVFSSNNKDPIRNLILVGHAPEGDLDSLRRLGATPPELPNLVEILDTAQLYRFFRREQNPKSVGSILNDFNLTGWHLHNAGNDAVYTMWIMLGTCVRAAADLGTKIAEDELKARQEKKLAERTAETTENTEDVKSKYTFNNDDCGGPVMEEVPPSILEKKVIKSAFGSWQAKCAE